MACFSRIISEMLPEIHIIEKGEFLTSIIYSQIIQFFFFIYDYCKCLKSTAQCPKSSCYCTYGMISNI